MKRPDFNKVSDNFEIISIEELKEIEYNLEYNPFDTTGTGYLEEDFTEYIIAQNEQAIEYHYKNKNITDQLLHKFTIIVNLCND